MLATLYICSGLESQWAKRPVFCLNLSKCVALVA